METLINEGTNWVLLIILAIEMSTPLEIVCQTMVNVLEIASIVSIS